MQGKTDAFCLAGCRVQWDRWNWVNIPQTAAGEAAVCRGRRRGEPFGSPAWTQQTGVELGLETTLHAGALQGKNSVDFHGLLFD